jgi:hypothetical protein
MRTVKDWKKARRSLESWRRRLTRLSVRLKRPRVIDVVPVDFITGEPVERLGEPRQAFSGQLVYFTGADATFRRPRGAILVVDTYELESISDGRTRVEP